MRQVNADELTYVIQSALRDVRSSLLKEAQHHDVDTRLRARLRIAGHIASKMARFEVLSPTPEGPPIRYAALSGTSGIGGFNDEP